jgi:hypothetical protein
MNSTCRALPTVEECIKATQSITQDCLRRCIELQCAGVQINCDEAARAKCKKDREEGILTLGYVWMNRTMTLEKTCKNPRREINWCEWDVSRECRAKGMVHELAHTCGWNHDQGLGVPGNDGTITCG